MTKLLIAGAIAGALALATGTALAAAPLIVCAAKDGTLHLSPGGSCKAGEKLMRFAEWEPETPDKPNDNDEKPAADPRIDDLSARLARLEAKSDQQRPDKTEALAVRALESKLSALSARVDAVDARAADKAKVAAMADTIEVEIHDLGVSLEAKLAALAARVPDPAKIINMANSIEEEIHGLRLRINALESAKGNDPASASTNSRTPAPASTVVAQRVQAPFEVVGSGGQVVLRVSDRGASASGAGALISIGPGDSGNYGLRIFKNGTTFIAGIREARDGGAGVVIANDASGNSSAVMNGKDHAVSVFSTDGNPEATMKYSDNGGLIAVLNGTQPIAYLTRSSGGDGGNVTTTLNNGFGVFSAGAAQDGAGEACVNRRTQAGTERPACIGLGLPSAGMGK